MKNCIKKMITILSLILISNHYNYILTQQVTAAQISAKTSDQIDQIITNFRVALVPQKSFLQVSIQEKEWNSWESFLIAAREYLKNQKQENAGLYQHFIYNLRNTNSWIVSTIINLQSKKISTQEYSKLHAEIQNKINNINNIYLTAFNKIVEDPIEGTALKKWKDTVSNKKVETIFPQLNQFLKDYQQATSIDQSSYKNRQAVIDEYVKKSAIQISTILEKLTQVIYLEEQKWFPSINITNAKSVLNNIKAQFPDVFYPYINAKYADAQNNHKPSVIIAGIAGTLVGILEHLQNDLKK